LSCWLDLNPIFGFGCYHPMTPHTVVQFRTISEKACPPDELIFHCIIWIPNLDKKLAS
jgi:hypothetical protein